MRLLPGLIAGFLSTGLLLITAAPTQAETVLAATTVIGEPPLTTATQASVQESSGQIQPQTRIYKYVNKDGVISFSDRAPMRTRYEIVSYSCYACNPRSKIDWYTTKLYLDAFDHPIRSAARKYAVDPALVRAVIHAESAFRPDVTSRKGAVGLMQLMPDTAKDMGVEDSTSPTQNIEGGVKYLAWLLEQHKGNVTLATAAYNAGPGAVKRHQGIPPFAETQTYVRRVKILHERYRKEMQAQEVASNL